MNCSDYKKEIMLFHANELPAERKAVLDAHLQLCPECVNFSFEISNSVRAFKDGGFKAQDMDIWPSVLEKIEKPRYIFVKWASAAALCFALISFIALRTSNKGEIAMVSSEAEIINEISSLEDNLFMEEQENFENGENFSQTLLPRASANNFV